MSRIVAIDVETTGISPLRGDRVIEIGAVLVEQGAICAEYSTLINVVNPIHPRAAEVHGITSDMLLGQALPEEVWPEFAEFVRGGILLAHNASFDIAFIRREFNRLNMEFANPFCCSLKKCRSLFPRLPNHRLETVARHLLGNLPTNCRLHRALDDARLVARVWLEMVKIAA